MKTIKLNQSEIEKAAEVLRNGEILAFPTETVYGVGVVYDNESAFKKLVNLKKRPPNKPFALMCASLEEALRYVDISEKSKKVMERFLPGELTVLVNAKKNLPSWVTLGTNVIGIRVPDDKYIRDLFHLLRKPCLVTSANRSGEPTSKYYEDTLRIFDGECAAIVKGECNSLIPTTIINLTNEDSISLVREGPISFDTIESFWRSYK